MRWATDNAGGDLDARQAADGAAARCPICDGELHLRRGLIRAAHWAHQPGADCPQQQRRLRRNQPHLFDLDSDTSGGRRRRRNPIVAADQTDGQLTFDLDNLTGSTAANATRQPARLPARNAERRSRFAWWAKLGRRWRRRRRSS